MKLVSFVLDDRPGYGAVIDERIVCLDTLPDAPADLRAFIEMGHANSVSLPSGAQSIDLHRADLRFLPPIPNPGKILCVATNFDEPSRQGKPLPEYPLVFTRFAESLTGHLGALHKPDVTTQFDFEGELAIVIGRHGHKIPRSCAMEYVAGYSCLNDGSVRDWQKHSTQFTPGKNFFRSGSMGPWLVTPDDVPDVSALILRTRVNGVVKQEISLARMIFDVSWLISYFSTFIPLAPGDVIATGTPSGFGSSRTPPEFLNSGDVVEVEIDGVGTLKNAVRDR